MIENLQELYRKPSSYKFNQEELLLIRKHFNASDYCVKYGFYKKQSNKGCQIAFIIDSYHTSPRRSGVENNWEIICTRPLCGIEIEEEIQNFGVNTRRFHVYYYKTIEFLISEDKKYEIKTPQKFIDECVKRGYCEKQTRQHEKVQKKNKN